MKIISILYYADLMLSLFFWVQGVPPEKYAKIAERRYKGMAEILSLERYYKPPGSVALRGE